MTRVSFGFLDGLATERQDPAHELLVLDIKLVAVLGDLACGKRRIGLQVAGQIAAAPLHQVGRDALALPSVAITGEILREVLQFGIQ
jgi:hypothetical protein